MTEKVISLYARGLTVRELQGHLQEIYGIEVSPDVISRITDAVLEDAKAWQNRPLERLYPIVYLDALVVKIREGHAVRNFACYVAIGVNLEGERDVLGLWFQRTEGAKFWMHVLTDLKQRGVADVLFFCVDGLTGFPEAIEATFPHSTVQTCLVHQVRASLKFVSYKDRKQVAADLRKIYTAANADHAADELQAFADKWDARYPTISQSWLDRWEQITPFLAYPQDVRRVIYTTNSIEALHRQTRKIIKTRGHFPTEDAARKLLYLAITKAETKWRQVRSTGTPRWRRSRSSSPTASPTMTSNAPPATSPRPSRLLPSQPSPATQVSSNWRNRPHPDLGGASRATGWQSREGHQASRTTQRSHRPDLDGQTARATTICQGRGGARKNQARTPTATSCKRRPQSHDTDPKRKTRVTP